MKKIVLSFFSMLLLISCSNETESTVQETQIVSTTEESKPTVPTTPEGKGKLAIENSDCLSCHKENSKLVGPSFKEIAEKYSEKDLNLLIEKIINGGKGVWGDTPMEPHPNLSKPDIQFMVQYILSLKST